jgi:hypothetical protein
MGCPGVYDANGGDYGGGDRVTLVIEVGRGVVYKCAEEWRELYILMLLVKCVAELY